MQLKFYFPLIMNKVWKSLLVTAGFIFCLQNFIREGVCLPQRRVTEYRMPGGFVVLCEYVPAAEPVNFGLLIKSGSATEKEFFGTGISHLLEHLIFKGKEKNSLTEIVGQCGGTCNAYTSRDFTYFTVTVPRQKWSVVLPCLLQSVFRPAFTEEDFQKEREVVLREIARNQDQPEYVVAREIWESAFLVHPYRFPISGYVPLLKNLTYQDVFRYHQTVYVPANAVLSVAGEINPDEVFSLCQNLLQPIHPGKPILHFFPAEPLPVTSRRQELSFPTELGYLSIASHIVALNHPDAPALDILANILGSGRNSGLYRNLVEKGLALSVSAWAYTPAQPGLFVISCVCQPENMARVEKVIREQLENLPRGVSRKELNRAVNQLRHDLLFSLQEVNFRAADLAYHYCLTGNTLYSRDYLLSLEKTTVADLRRVASTYLNTQHLIVVSLTGKKKTMETQGEKTSTVNQVRQKILPQGLCLLLCEDFRLPIVSFSVFFKGGLLWEKEETAGLFPILTALLSSGTRKHDAYTIGDLVASWSGRLTTYSGNNSFGLTISLPEKYWRKALALLAEIVREPAFPEKELEKTKKNTFTGLVARGENPLAVAEDLLRKEIFGNHPYGLPREGTKQSVNNISRKLLLETYKKLWTKGNVVLTASGAINQEEIIKEVDRLFPRLSDFSIEEVIPFKPEEKNMLLKTARLPRKETTVMVGYPGLSVENSERAYLEIISEYLNDQDGLLFQRLREKEPLVYACGFSYFLGLQPGLLFFYAQCHPEKTHRVMQVFDEVIDQLVQKLLPPDEMEKLKIKVAGNRMLNRETISDRAREYGLSVLYGLGLDFEKKIEQIVWEAKAEQIQSFCARYFQKKYQVKIIVGPDTEKSSSNSISSGQQ